MKVSLQSVCVALLWLAGFASSSAYLIVDGRGIFGVVVEVREASSGNPLDGVNVSLADSGRDQLGNFDRADDMKRLLPLFDQSKTNLAGQTVVYYFGGLSEETGKGRTQGVRGKLLLRKGGYEDVAIELRDILGPSVKSDEHNLPRAVVYMKKR